MATVSAINVAKNSFAVFANCSQFSGGREGSEKTVIINDGAIKTNIKRLI